MQTDTTIASQLIGARQIMLTKKRTLTEDKANARMLLKYSNAVVFRWQRGKFMCAHCPENFVNFTDLRIHSAKHNNFDIIETNKTRLIFPLNLDISSLACSICNVSIKDIEYLKSHLSNDHSISTDGKYADGVIPYRLVGERLQCVICESSFDKFMTLFSHMNKHYPNYTCDFCGKAFSAANKLRSHNTIHNPGTFKCNECDAIFTNRAAKNRHVSEKHRPKERYKCPICDKHLNSYYMRLQHLKIVHGQTSEYRCSFCPTVFDSGSARYNHIQSFHLKKRCKKKKYS